MKGKTFVFPDACSKLICVRCGHFISGHIDTAGHFIQGCHWDWDDFPRVEGCLCDGFTLKFNVREA
jgi:hypothetical protein